MNDHVDDNVACPRSRGIPIDDFDEDYFCVSLQRLQRP